MAATRTSANVLTYARGLVTSHTLIPADMCLQRVRLAYNITTTAGNRNAVMAWTNAKRKHRVTDPLQIPTGVPVYWDGHVGHVAISSDRPGYVLTPGSKAAPTHWTEVPIESIAAGWPWHRLLGWTEDLNGVPVYVPPARPAPIGQTPVAPPLELRYGHYSMQRTDPRDQQAADVKVQFARGHQVIAWTEIGPTENPAGRALVKAAAKAHGYQLYLHGGEGIAVRIPGAVVIAKGYGLNGKPFVAGRSGQYPDRGLVWITVEAPDYGVLTFGVFHSNPQDTLPARHATNLTIARNVAKTVKAKARGNHIMVVSADTNVDDAHDGPSSSTAPLTRAGLVSCWDERRKHPGTLGARTVDVIYRYKPDARVRLTGCRAYPKGHSDHRGMQATYVIRPIGGNR